MEDTYNIPLRRLIDEFDLEVIHMPDMPENIKINCSRVNRPGLQIAGFYNYYEGARLQIIGKMEDNFIKTLAPEERAARLDAFFATKPVGVIVTTSIGIDDAMLRAAETYGVPLMRTSERTSEFMAAVIAYLNVQLGPRITRHGVLVEVYGEGILLIGDSGVG